jgi:hypothetical protein
VCERKALLQGAILSMDIRVCAIFILSSPALPQLKCLGGCLGAEMAIKVLVRWNTEPWCTAIVSCARAVHVTERAPLRQCWSVPRPRTIPRRVQKRSDALMHSLHLPASPPPSDLSRAWIKLTHARSPSGAAFLRCTKCRRYVLSCLSVTTLVR